MRMCSECAFYARSSLGIVPEDAIELLGPQECARREIVLLIATVVSARTEAEGRVLGLNATLVEAQSLANTGSWEFFNFFAQLFY
jgi:hypothetical protein